MSQHRNFCFTWPNYSVDNETVLSNLTVRYLISGKEVCPTTLTPHIQGFVVFKFPKTLAQVIKLLKPAHVEVAKGSVDQNIAYCSKEGQFVEFGEPPVSQERKGELERERWALALCAYQEGRFIDVPPDIGIRYACGLETWSKKLSQKFLPDTETKHLWYYGAPKTGKSRKARLDNPGAYIKDPQTRWWTNYKDEDVVIIDDFDKYQKAQGGDMKRWLDRYPFQAPYHGGQVMARPRLIIVTSNYHPEDIWGDDEITVAAIKRRVEIVRFDSMFAEK